MAADSPYVPTDAIPPKYFAGRKNILEGAREIMRNGFGMAKGASTRIEKDDTHIDLR